MGILWSKSGEVTLDNNGDPADGAEAEFFVGGTTTPLAVYQDAAETTPHEDPVEADANGRWPAVYIGFSDAGYGVKVSTSGGTQLYYFTTVPNADPVEASEDSVDDAELYQTGDLKIRFGTGTLTGYVRCNGRTLGSAASGATERANDDTEDLYTYLWDTFSDSILAVATGRGASAAADFAANKPIALFNGRSAFICGADDMGNSAQGIGYGGSFTTGSAIIGGSIGGANTHTLSTAEAPAHTHSVSGTTDSDGSHTHTANVTDPGHTHTIPNSATGNLGAGANSAWLTAAGGDKPTASGTTGISVSIVAGGAHTHAFSATSGSTGGGGAHNNMPKHIICTYYLKL